MTNMYDFELVRLVIPWGLGREALLRKHRPRITDQHLLLPGDTIAGEELSFIAPSLDHAHFPGCQNDGLRVRKI